MDDYSHNRPALSVSELSASLKATIESTFTEVRVRGEISGFKAAASGHLYFNLKDDQAVMNAIVWRGVSGRFGFKPEDGLEVIATGRLSIYPGRSSYQIIIEQMEPAGAGALLAMLEKRKAMFAAEGLFAPERKKKIPFLPRTIGIVTSPTGAVIRDMLHRLSERFPVKVQLWPVLVQGEGAAEQIAKAIEGFNEFTDKPDLLIVARGGGSLEDLWAFNEEVVVRAAAASTIPLISAVGHETDTTLIDYVSDLRAPTPTGAAEKAVPVRADLIAMLLDAERRLHSGTARFLDRLTTQVQEYGRAFLHPERLVETLSLRLDDWSERLTGALPRLVEVKAERLSAISSRMAQPLLRLLERNESRLTNFSALLNSYSYTHTLARGFALVRGKADKALKSTAAMAQAAGSLTLTFHDGDVNVTTGEAAGPKPKKKSSSGESNQGLLFES